MNYINEEALQTLEQFLIDNKTLVKVNLDGTKINSFDTLMNFFESLTQRVNPLYVSWPLYDLIRLSVDKKGYFKLFKLLQNLKKPLNERNKNNFKYGDQIFYCEFGKIFPTYLTNEKIKKLKKMKIRPIVNESKQNEKENIPNNEQNAFELDNETFTNESHNKPKKRRMTNESYSKHNEHKMTNENDSKPKRRRMTSVSNYANESYDISKRHRMTNESYSKHKERQVTNVSSTDESDVSAKAQHKNLRLMEDISIDSDSYESNKKNNNKNSHRLITDDSYNDKLRKQQNNNKIQKNIITPTKANLISPSKSPKNIYLDDSDESDIESDDENLIKLPPLPKLDNSAQILELENDFSFQMLLKNI